MLIIIIYNISEDTWQYDYYNIIIIIIIDSFVNSIYKHDTENEDELLYCIII